MAAWISTSELDDTNFLIMNCFEPYMIDDSGHLGAFLRNVVALMLELTDH
jgi:hypothetical protein